METYPHTPGHKATDTSASAAQAMAPKARYLRQRVYNSLFLDGPATTDEVAERLCIDILSIRPRFSELKTKRLIEDSGARRKNASGRNAIVWQAIEV